MLLMKPKRAIFTLLLLLIMGGCMQPKPPTIPEWMSSNPTDSDTLLYKSAIGKTELEAKENALALLGSSLFSTLKQYVTRVESAEYIDAILYNASLQCRSLNYPQSTVVKHQEQEEQHIVLVSVDRKALALDQKQKLDINLERVESLLVDIESRASMVKLHRLHTASKALSALYAQMYLLQVIDPKTKISDYKKRFKKIRREYNRLKFSLLVRVIGDAESIYFIKPLQDALISEGLTLSSNSSKTKPITILLSTDSKQSRAANIKIESMWLQISIQESNKEISLNELEFSGRSPDSFSKASQDAADKFKKELKKHGLFVVLGLE